MIIRVAESSGFCFGVDNAMKKAEAMLRLREDLSDPRPHYMLGAIIHNERVVSDLVARGLDKADTPADIPDGARVLIRAHGVAPAIREALEAKGADVVDCTCPYVTRIHRLVRDACGQGERVYLAGVLGHPEVEGILGECSRHAMLVESAASLDGMELPDVPSILVSQTTFSKQEFDEIRSRLSKQIANLKIFDTICSTTANRQKEALELASTSDLMLVVGSRSSANARKLFEACRSRCGETYLVESPSDVFRILAGRDKLESMRVGITAGASTPQRMIREVVHNMSEIEANGIQQDHGDVSFTDFIDRIPQISRGTTVRGTIIRKDNENVHVDVGDKSEGRIPLREFEEDPEFDLDKAIAEHLEIDVYVRSIRNTEMGREIVLSKARVDFGKYKALVEDAYKNHTPIQVKVTNLVKDGVIAAFGGIDVYIHRTQLDLSIVDNLEEWKGQTLDILVTQFDPERKRIRVAGSRRALLNYERKSKAEELWNHIERNQVYLGIVRSLTDFGAFVDIGGVDGLVHVTELSWNRIRHPSEVVKVGDKIEVYIKDFDLERRRISLGFKKAEDDPYRDVENRFPVGSIVHGKVVRMFPFGAFVEIAPGVDALCHISQISNVRLNKPGEALTEGMEVDARVLEVSSDTRRISISIREVEPIDPKPVDMPAGKESETTATSHTDAGFNVPDAADHPDEAPVSGEPAAVEEPVTTEEPAAVEVPAVVEEAPGEKTVVDEASGEKTEPTESE